MKCLLKYAQRYYKIGTVIEPFYRKYIEAIVIEEPFCVDNSQNVYIKVKIELEIITIAIFTEKLNWTKIIEIPEEILLNSKIEKLEVL